MLHIWSYPGIIDIIFLESIFFLYYGFLLRCHKKTAGGIWFRGKFLLPSSCGFHRFPPSPPPEEDPSGPGDGFFDTKNETFSGELGDPDKGMMYSIRFVGI